MEVHHHPDLHHHRKPWKEYLLEFLMIFLAVTMGFYAESLREKLINGKKERHYIDNILSDLKRDTSDMGHVLYWQQFLNIRMDKALSVPADHLREISLQDTFYKNFVFFYAWIEYMNANDNTFIQLKNAGGFSVIHKSNVTDSISRFYNYYAANLKVNNDWYNASFIKTNDVAVQLMKLPAPPLALTDTAFAVIPKNTEVFTRYDKPLIEQLYNNIRYEKGTLLFVMKIEKEYKIKATGLIALLKKEYHLESK